MYKNDEREECTVLDNVIRLQNSLVSCATGGGFDGGDPVYQRLRRELLDRADIRDKVPDYVRRSRDTNQFWQFIKHKLDTYAERRVFIWDSFHSLIEYLEAIDRSPGVQPITETLERFDPQTVQAVWQKALDRRAEDPDGAITAARSLLESVCKHILDDASVEYPHDADLPKLWALCSVEVNLAPHQHQEHVFKSILGNCQSIVNNLAFIRNKIGDAHGQGRKPVKPTSRHAELAVNLAGTMAAFLVATWENDTGKSGQPK
ncbi:abortive infection family protein [Azospirillum sp. Marseille-Q6669]